MAHPTGLQLTSNYNEKDGLTPAPPAMQIRRVLVGMANRLNDPPPLKGKAPDQAATGSSAKIPHQAGGHDRVSTTHRPRIAGTLSIRVGTAVRHG